MATLKCSAVGTVRNSSTFHTNTHARRHTHPHTNTHTESIIRLIKKKTDSLSNHEINKSEIKLNKCVQTVFCKENISDFDHLSKMCHCLFLTVGRTFIER